MKADEIFVLMLILACVAIVLVINRHSKRRAQTGPSDIATSRRPVPAPDRHRGAEAAGDRPKHAMTEPTLERLNELALEPTHTAFAESRPNQTIAQALDSIRAQSRNSADRW